MPSLRDQLVNSTLEWREKYGNAPTITQSISEYDAARLIGMSEEEYSERTIDSRRRFNFIYKKKRYQVHGTRQFSQLPESVAIEKKTIKYGCNYFIRVLYNKSYEIQEAWLWDINSVNGPDTGKGLKQYFESNDRMTFADLRLGKCLEDAQKTWLEKLLINSRNRNWCVKGGCTTCGNHYFRINLAESLSRKIGFNFPENAPRWLRDYPSDHMLSCFKETVKTIEELPKSNLDQHDKDALNLLLQDLCRARLAPEINNNVEELPESNLNRQGLLNVLLNGSYPVRSDSEINDEQPYQRITNGTWVGEKFREWEEERRRREEEYNSPERVEERRRRNEEEAAAQALAAERRKERAERRKWHEEHNRLLEERRLEEQAKFERELATRNFLDDYSHCDERGRLLKLENEDFIPLGAIPSELIPLDPQIVSSLSRESKIKLLSRISRHRRKGWEILRNILKNSL
mgnify:CR=1 FL=1